MKKLLSLFAAGLLAMPMFAQEQTVSFNFTTEEGLAELGLTKPEPNHGYNFYGEFVKDDVTIAVTSPEGATGNNAVKIFTGSNGKTRLEFQPNCGATFSLSALEGFVITKIHMTGYSMRPVFESGKWTPKGNSYTSGDWEGSADAVSFTAQDGFQVYTIDVTYTEDEQVGVEGIAHDKAVKGVRYYNLAGHQSAELMPGVNIVVVDYQDGTQQVTKVMK